MGIDSNRVQKVVRDLFEKYKTEQIPNNSQWREKFNKNLGCL